MRRASSRAALLAFLALAASCGPKSSPPTPFPTATQTRTRTNTPDATATATPEPEQIRSDVGVLRQ